MKERKWLIMKKFNVLRGWLPEERSSPESSDRLFFRQCHGKELP